MPLDFAKLKNIINESNSCYLDSFLIFMVIYRNTAFFRQFYEMPVNSDIFTGKYKIYAEQLYNAIKKLYAELDKYSPNNTTCSNYRNIIRTTIGLIVPKLNDKFGSKQTTLNPDSLAKYPTDWRSGQQDPVDLLSILTNIFGVDTSGLEIYHSYGFKYVAGKYNKVDNINPELETIRTSNASLYNSYVSKAEQYVYTLNFNTNTQQPEMPIFAESIIEPPKELTLDGLKDMLISGIGLPGNNSLVRFSGCDIINKQYYPYKEIKGNGNVTLLENTISFDNMLFANWCVGKTAPIYIINVNRVVKADSTIQNFINTQIDIPETLINTCMEPDTIYRFVGAIVHAGFKAGTKTQGHYTAFILNPGDNKYYFYNDGGKEILTEVGDFNAVLDYIPTGDMTAPIRTNCTTLFYLPEDEINNATRDINTSSQVATPATRAESTEEDEEYYEADEGEPYNTLPPPHQKAAPKITLPPYNPNKKLINFVVFQ